VSGLPATWDLRPLAEVCQPAAKMDPVTTGRASVRYVDIGSVDGSTHKLLQVPEVDSATAPSRCRQVVHSGDTVFSTVRPYLEKIAFIDSSLDNEFASTGFCVLRPTPDLEPRFLFYFASSKGLLDQVLPMQKGVSYPAVLDREVRGCTIPVPPLPEQRRIVAILEAHLTRLEDAERQLGSACQRLRGLRDRTVRDALTGTSVPGPRQPAVLPDVGTNDGHLVSLPAGWAWARLGEVAEVVGGVTKDVKKQSDPGLPEVPYLRVANVQRGRIDLTQVTKIRVPRARAAALTLRPGDILLNEGGDRDKLGRGWVWEGQIDGCIHQNHVFRARLTDHGLDPYFVSWTTNSFGGGWAERNGKQSVNLASISLSKIRQMPVIVPPPGVAKAVAAKLADDMASFDRLESEVVRAATRAGQLRRSLLAAAFSGQLTGRSSDTDIIEDLADEEAS